MTMADLRRISSMTAKELDVLVDSLGSSRRYLEFGMGNSTRLACQNESINRIDVVESSADYASVIESMYSEIHVAKESGRLHLHLIDIGKTKAWGFPIDDSHKEAWKQYPESVHELEGGWDTVLIDGRFRVACVVNVLLRVDSCCRILIHDFWNRNSYHVVLNYLDVLRSVDTLGVFQKRANCRENELETLRIQYQNCVA
jgi:hypothetical protein